MKKGKGIVQIIVLMMAICVPTFAASTNHVDKMITVKDNGVIEASLAPQLNIKLQENLKKGNQFYLQLENAHWQDNILDQLEANPDFIFKRENKSSLLVEAKKDLVASQTPYKIPLIVKTTSGLATVEIISNDTVVTGGKYPFAQSKNMKSTISVKDAKVFATVGEMASISIEEEYIGAFASNKLQTMTIELNSKGIEFNYDVGYTIPNAIDGEKAYQGKRFDAKMIDKTRLEVQIPANSLNETQKGSLNLSGIQIKADENAVYGDIKAIISSDFTDTVELIVGKYGNYATELRAEDDYKAISGQPLKNIEFTLEEIVPDSLYGKRETIFTFPQEIKIESIEIIKAQGLAQGAEKPVISIDKKEGKNINSFKIASIDVDKTKNTKITFLATLKVPASFKGIIDLTAEGRSLENKKHAVIAKVDPPITIDISPLTAKVGFAQQVGGKVILQETAKGSLTPGEIFLAFDDEAIHYTKAPEVTVTQGNIKVDSNIKIIPGGLAVTVNGKSTKPSTIEINGGEFKVNALVAEGNYKVKIGGPAISAYSDDILRDKLTKDYNLIDQVAEEDFIYLGTRPTSNKAEFVIDKINYTKDGIKQAMDTSPYLSQEGRTMLPVRYVADALGIPSNQIIWDPVDRAVIIMEEGVGTLSTIIRIELVSKYMIINNVKIEMASAAEMKNNRVFIPVAEIARALGANVTWDESSLTASFSR